MRCARAPQRGDPVISTMSNWRQSGIVVREARPRDLDAIARLENEIVRDRPGLAPVIARIPARRPSAGDRGDHRRRTGGLRAGLAAQDLAGGAHLFARGRRPIRPPRRRPGAACRPARPMRGATAAPRSPSKCATTTPSAIALYESSGFRQFGEHAHYYADGATALRYEKSLAPRSRSRNREQSPAEARSTVARRIAPALGERRSAESESRPSRVNPARAEPQGPFRPSSCRRRRD